MDSGVATRPLPSLKAYRESLHHRVYRTGMAMKPVFDRAREVETRVVFAEGTNDKVLQCVQQVLDQGIARPVLIGRREAVARHIRTLGLGLEIDRDFELLDPHNNARFEDYCRTFYRRVQRLGYSPQEAREYVRNDSTVLAATMLASGDADAMICGTVGRYLRHVRHIEEVIGLANGVNRLTSMNALVLHTGTLFIADTYLQVDPSAEDLAEIVRLTADEVRWFGEQPRVALLSHSTFGSHDSPSARKMRTALHLVRTHLPELEVEGEMHADLALNPIIRAERFPNSQLLDRANLLIMPNQDAANIAFNLLKLLGDGIAIGPILLGAARSAHVVTPSITVRGLLNMTALAAVRAR
jgi:malate dehydrogenase (oxaloacetate-decarboxylating)(NADP+)